MGIIRFLKRSVIPGQMAVDIVKSVIEEKNLVKRDFYRRYTRFSRSLQYGKI